MRKLVFVLLILCLTAVCAKADRMMGKVTCVYGNRVDVSFPCPVQSRSIIMILSGERESVSGMAISTKCNGSAPCTVTGEISFMAESSPIVAGSRAYVNSLNARPVACKPPRSAAKKPNSTLDDNDLSLYYYAAGQTVGTGAAGFGYNRTLLLNRSVGLEIDGAYATLAPIENTETLVFDENQSVTNLKGRVKLNFSPSVGVYSGYMWSQGKGDDAWSDLSFGSSFVGPSSLEAGVVEQQGFEYGILLHPAKSFSISLGVVPQLRTDYGAVGVSEGLGYTGEIRIGRGRGSLRLRGLSSQDYWSADVGISLW